MAKGFKKQLQGGGFQNLSISGSAQLQNMRIQSDIEINALKEQRARPVSYTHLRAHET